MTEKEGFSSTFVSGTKALKMKKFNLKYCCPTSSQL